MGNLEAKTNSARQNAKPEDRQLETELGQKTGSEGLSSANTSSFADRTSAQLGNSNANPNVPGIEPKPVSTLLLELVDRSRKLAEDLQGYLKNGGVGGQQMVVVGGRVKQFGADLLELLNSTEAFERKANLLSFGAADVGAFRDAGASGGAAASVNSLRYVGAANKEIARELGEISTTSQVLYGAVNKLDLLINNPSQIGNQSARDQTLSEEIRETITQLNIFNTVVSSKTLARGGSSIAQPALQNSADRRNRTPHS